MKISRILDCTQKEEDRRRGDVQRGRSRLEREEENERVVELRTEGEVIDDEREVIDDEREFMLELRSEGNEKKKRYMKEGEG